MTTLEHQIRRYATDVVAPPRGPVPPEPRTDRGRRLAFVAALLVFVGVVGALIVRASGSEDGGPAPVASASPSVVLPPEGARNVEVSGGSEHGVSSVNYDGPNGIRLTLFTFDGDQAGTSREQFQLFVDSYLVSVTETAEIAPVGLVSLDCEDSPDRLAAATWVVGNRLTSVVETAGPAQPCAERLAELRRQVGALRLVTESEWSAYFDEHPRVTVPDTVPEKGSLAVWCTLVEEYRSSGTVDASTGQPTGEALPFLQRMRDAAPDDLRPAMQTVVDWVEQGAPMPPSAEVMAAQVRTTGDWATRCPQGTTG